MPSPKPPYKGDGQLWRGKYVSGRAANGDGGGGGSTVGSLVDRTGGTMRDGGTDSDEDGRRDPSCRRSCAPTLAAHHTNAATAANLIALQYSMPYPEFFVEPMRQELTQLGIEELRTPADVDAAVTKTDGTLMVVVNSVCGCAAGKARPGIALALRHANKPDRVATVFAGADVEATDRARGYFTGYQPSSPSIALFQNGTLVYMLERRNIENRDAYAIATELTQAFDKYCAIPNAK